MANPFQPGTATNTSTCNQSAWSMAVAGAEVTTSTKPSHSQEDLIQPLELQKLMIRGFSQSEISTAEKTLQQRKITPTFEAVSNFLDLGVRTDMSSLFRLLGDTINQTSGVHSKVRLADSLLKYARSLNAEAFNTFDHHYSSLWPSRLKIETIVDRWPEALKEQAGYIKRCWPKLAVKGGGIKFDFDSATKVCCIYRPGLYDTPSCLGYLALFRLIKDIWFDALLTNNTCVMNRVSHLLISFTKAISGSTIEFEGSTRKEKFEIAIQRELNRGISSTYDIGAFAFLLVTNPTLWLDHRSNTFELMTNRALDTKAHKLAPLHPQWQDESQRDQTCKTIEAEVIPEIAITMHYLESIYNHLMSYRSDCSYWVRKTLSEEIADGDYFDSITNQLADPIPIVDWKTLPPLPEVKEALSQFYANPNHQALFLGTEEYKAYQKEQRRQEARHRFSDAIKRTIKKNKKQKADLIKKQFKEQGFVAAKDNQGNISYGEGFYVQRKKYVDHLKNQKQAVEQHIGVPIPFKVRASQLNQILDAFEELPIAEQRYWKMSRAYAESTAIPELIADLTLTQDPGSLETLDHNYEDLLERQSKFINCRCSECTVCATTRYLCECRDGLNQRIAKRENRHRDSILKQKIVKSIAAHYAKNFCTAGTPVPEKVGQTATPSAQAMTQNPDIRRRKRRLKFRAYRDNRTLSQSAKMPRLEHVLTSGSQCEKKHRPKSVIDKYQRQLVTKVLHKKIYSPVKWEQRHRREAEPAGLRKYNKVLRKLYKTHSDNAPPRLSTDEILDWFYKNPEPAANAVDQLQGKPQEIRSLFKSGTLEFEEPMSLKAIPCQRIYHNIESFNKHLSDLAAGKDNNFVPLSSKKAKGLYLHKTFCLACRTNFGQKRELKAHLTTHQAAMEKTFESIRAIPHVPTDEHAAYAMLGGSPVICRDPQAFEQNPVVQQPKAIAAIFEHESV